MVMAGLEKTWGDMSGKPEQEVRAKTEAFVRSCGSAKCGNRQYMEVTARNAVQAMCGKGQLGVAGDIDVAPHGDAPPRPVAEVGQGLKGLVNAGGTTCYHKSVMQCLYHAEKFRDDVEKCARGAEQLGRPLRALVENVERISSGLARAATLQQSIAADFFKEEKGQRRDASEVFERCRFEMYDRGESCCDEFRIPVSPPARCARSVGADGQKRRSPLGRLRTSHGPKRKICRVPQTHMNARPSWTALIGTTALNAKSMSRLLRGPPRSAAYQLHL